LANNEVRDSILFGGDGIRGNADDWGADSVMVLKITVCPEEGEDRNAPGTRAAVIDTAALYPNRWKFVLTMVSGTCFDTVWEGSSRTIDNMYFAGQTSPGAEGVQWFGGRWLFQHNGADVNSDWVMRYVKQRGLQNQGLMLSEGERIVFDHIEGAYTGAAGGQYSWGAITDSIGDTNEFYRHISYSWSFAHEPRIDHSTLAVVGSSPRPSPAGSKSMMLNSFMGGRGHRCPMLNGDTIMAANILVYNCVDRQTQIERQAFVSVVGLLNHVGPGTQIGQGRHMPMRVGDHCVRPGDSAGADSTCTERVYASRFSWIYPAGGDTLWNVTGTNLWRGADSLILCRDLSTDSELGTMDPSWTCGTSGDTVHSGVYSGVVPFTAADFDMPDYFYPDTTGFADTTAIMLHLDSVGAAFRLTCAGEWVSQRDTISKDAIGRFRNDLRESGTIGKGGRMDNAPGGFHVYTNTQIGQALGLADTDSVTVSLNRVTATVRYVGPDTLATVTNCTDADGDGMPAAFEALHAGLDDSDATDRASDDDFDGYIAIEEYLNGTNPNIFTNAADGSETTYGSTVYIYRAKSTAQDTLCFDATGAATTCPAIDTMIVRTWDGDSIPAGGVGKACWDGDSVRYFVSEATLSGGNLLDSLAADTLLADVIQAGCDTATVKDTSRVPNT
jgi:hypothetical protein